MFANLLSHISSDFTMVNISHDRWNWDFMSVSPLFFPLQTQARLLSCKPQYWPSLEDYQVLLAQQPIPIHSLGGAAIQFVPQTAKPLQWQDDYEPRIYLTGEVQTRSENWHDFFQVLVWNTFPLTKAMLNAKHYQAIRQRKQFNPDSKQRTPVENALTQFDECGSIVVSCDNTLLECIHKFRWKDLFWQHRSELTTRLSCFVFGHAVYEKALNPYIGLTAHAVLFHVEASFFQWPLSRQLAYLDNITAHAFEYNHYPSPKHLQPFPLLGMPEWDDNNAEAYYDNTDYFRAGRRK
jgi:hypothetical protein